MSTPVAGALAVTPLYATSADAIVSWDDPGQTWRSLAVMTAPGTVTLTGDVTGSGTTAIPATVVRLQGRPLAATAPTTNQVIQWSGTQWVPGTITVSGGTVTSISAGTGITVSPSPIVGAGTVSLTAPVSVANGGTGTATVFTLGSVLFAGASGVYAQDNANLFWDDANNRLGIGTTSPGYRLVVNQNAATPPALVLAGSVAQFAGANSQSTRVAVSSFSGVAAVDLIASGGTAAAPSTAGASLGALTGGGFDGTTYGVGALAYFSPTETWGATAHGMAIGFQTTTNGTTANVDRMTIANNGNVGIGTASPGSTLDVRGAVNVHAANNTSAVGLLSDGAGNYTGYSIGRTAPECYWGIAGGVNQFLTGTVAGDICLFGNTAPGKLMLGAGNAPRLTIDTTGFTTSALYPWNSATGSIQNNGSNAWIYRDLTHYFQSAAAANYCRFDGAGTANVTGAWAVISAREMKQEIAPYTRGLDALVQLQPIVFRYRAGTPFAKSEDEPSEPQIGLLAEEVEPYLPELVGETTAMVGKEEVAVASLTPGNALYAMINAIKELATRVEQLEAAAS